MSIIEKAVGKLAGADSAKEQELQELSDARTNGELLSGISDAEIQQSLDGAEGFGVDTPGGAAVDPGLVDISFADLNLEGILSPQSGRSRLDEEYRMIKRPLLVRAFDGRNLGGRPLNLIMVTSAISGEGKTYTTLNLAISIAMELDRTILMVDSDLAKPSLSRLLGISDRPGFTECLNDQSLDLGQFLLKTDVPKLSVLPAGTRNNRATELLASNSMSARLEELSSRYSDRIVLFDSPPLLATSESSVLASHMGQVAVVVEYGATPRFMIKEALQLLHNEDSVSLILNKTRDDFLAKHVGGYGYGYGKGYGYGAYGDK
ncbi:MAG: AAA family ATPase [Chromatiaceae bacterium]|nr:XrtA-associated tyrosine autokinase [Gammaproteobacteria bacterium]MCP5428258.1 AAA family ATPase [Chromatiaceae bacterium]MCB1861917.1 XrtA-associated tyrosine autokinase [Gammaproteobacteria bacterium]MCB1874108.1 XrtA-associated tyrosine autokinase [Gammaproteobacteria bacterium]MCB1879120.1 XrtA-associated tyrosine autokinase [Gammaproteobacteria bacterium]